MLFKATLTNELTAKYKIRRELMKQLCKSIGYWCLLIFCFTIGILLVGAFLLLWSMGANFAFSLENIFGLATGAIFLAMSFLFYENRIYFPLRRTGQKKNQPAADKLKKDFCPNMIDEKRYNAIHPTAGGERKTTLH